MSTQRALRLAASVPWAITEQGLHQILEVAARENMSIEAVEAALGRELDNTRTITVRDGVAIVPVVGPLFRYGNIFTRISGGSSYDVLARDFNAALEDHSVRAILLNVDSPGGEVKGCQELADMIFAARGRKPMAAYVDGWAASGGYWLTSAAPEIVIAETAMLGSIGVIATYLDTSKADEKAGLREIEIISSVSPNKAPDPAATEGRAQIQSWIDTLGEIFAGSVARNLGITAQEVIQRGGAGDLRIGAEAVTAGLAHRTGSFEAVLAELAEQGRNFRAGRPAGTSITRSNAMSTETQPAAGQSQPVTRDFLIANHADLIESFRAEGREAGATAERERILGIEELTVKGHEQLVSDMKRDPKITKAEAAVRLIQAEQKAGTSTLQGMRAAESDLAAPEATPNAGVERPKSRDEKVGFLLSSAGKTPKQKKAATN